jgi:hypothetical protein
MSEAEGSKLRELVQRAAADPEFAERLLTEPESMATEYGLTTDQIHKIRELAGAGLLQPAVQAHDAPVDGGGGKYY